MAKSVNENVEALVILPEDLTEYDPEEYCLQCDVCEIEYTVSDYAILKEHKKLVYFLFEKEFCICHSCLFEEVASAAGKDKKVRVKVLDGDKMYYLTFDGKKYNWDIPPDEPQQN
jgi:hypothetical protein